MGVPGVIPGYVPEHVRSAETALKSCPGDWCSNVFFCILARLDSVAPSTGMCEPKPAGWFSLERDELDSKKF